MGIASSVKSDIVSQKDPQRINVLFVCGEWNSSKGGLATFNRQSAINLAKTASDKIKVFCYVSQSNEGEGKDAKEHGVHMITAKCIPGTSDPLEWLRVPPQQLSQPDVVIGHGLKFGTPACCIARATSCKWVHFVHVFYEDLGKYKQTGEKAVSSPDTIEENEKKHKEEIGLCKEANAVIAVGSRLQQRYCRCLQGIEVDVITPGILETFCHLSDQKERHSSDEFSIFVFGRARFEDLALKGYDIIANAVRQLGKKFSVTFVGASEGQHSTITEWFQEKTRIPPKQLTIRGYCNQEELIGMFYEADMVAMPSRTEGFGLVALEAMSAGIPILVTRESGIANALDRVEGGKSVIVESEEAEEWAQKIKMLSEQKPEERHKSAISLRENYNITYSWSSQCQRFKKKLVALKIMNESCPANQVDAYPENQSACHDSSSNSLPSVNTVSQAPQHTWRNGEADSTANGDSSFPTERSTQTAFNEKEAYSAERNVPEAPHDQSTSTSEVGVLPRIDERQDDDCSRSGREQEEEGKPGQGEEEEEEEPRVEFTGGNKPEQERERPVSAQSDDYVEGSRPSICAEHEKERERHRESVHASETVLTKGASIHDAAKNGDLDRIKELINVVPEMKSKMDEHRRNPLHIAVTNGRLECVKWLALSGVDLAEETSTGYTAMHLAAMDGHVNCMMILSAMGSTLSCRTVDELTPLHLACMSGHTECVKWLIANKANVEVVDKRDRTPLDIAEENRFEELVKLLKKCKKELTQKDSTLAQLLTSESKRRKSVDSMGSDQDGVPSKVSDNGESGVDSCISDTEDKKKIFDKQQKVMNKQKLSFLDNIRMEVDNSSAD